MKPATRRSKRKLKRAHRKLRTSAGKAAREVIRADMKKIEGRTRGLEKFSGNRTVRKNGAIRQSASASVFRHPKTELEAAIQRYVDLFDFAPIGYVTFDRVGRIEEINVTATRLVGRAHKHLIGAPFVVCVAKTDAQLFLRHLLECRFSKGPVETELHLKTREGVEFPVLLSSTPASSSMKNGAMLFQTA